MRKIKADKTFIIIILSIIIIIIIASICWIYLKNKPYQNPVALVYQNGTLFKEIDLSETYTFVIENENGGFNTISVEHGEIGIIDANCPDHICVKTGFINKGAVPIICLPNRVEIRISEKETLDNGNADIVLR